MDFWYFLPGLFKICIHVLSPHAMCCRQYILYLYLICHVCFPKYGLSIRRGLMLNCTHFQQQFKLLSQPDNTEILGYALGLLSFVIACTSRFPAICRAVSGTQHKSVFMSKQHHSAFSYNEVEVFKPTYFSSFLPYSTEVTS